MREINADGTVHVLVPVSATEDGQPVNPTSDTVQMAFTTNGARAAVGDYRTADWETDATTDPPTYYARCLIGAGGTGALRVGIYQVTVKVTHSPEIAPLDGGRIKIV